MPVRGDKSSNSSDGNISDENSNNSYKLWK